MKRTIVSDTCEVICEDNGRKMVADILSFQEGKFLSVSLDKKLKLELKWNRNIYEGRMSGLTFVSEGPTIQNVQQSRR